MSQRDNLSGGSGGGSRWNQSRYAPPFTGILRGKRVESLNGVKSRSRMRRRSLLRESCAGLAAGPKPDLPPAKMLAAEYGSWSQNAAPYAGTLA